MCRFAVYLGYTSSRVVTVLHPTIFSFPKNTFDFVCDASAKTTARLPEKEKKQAVAQQPALFLHIVPQSPVNPRRQK